MKSGKTRYAAIVALAVWAAPVHANEFSDRLILWLDQQGYTQFKIERTWLGRIKIEAYADGIEREIILNARTGEILRDYWELEAAGAVVSDSILLAVPEGIGNTRSVQPIQAIESSSDKDDEDDDDDDDEGDDWESSDAEDSEDSSDSDEGDEEDEEDEEDEDDDDEGDDDEDEDDD